MSRDFEGSSWILRDFKGCSSILRDSKEILVFLGILRNSGIKGFSNSGIKGF